MKYPFVMKIDTQVLKCSKFFPFENTSRDYSISDYRFKFNTQEKIDEISGKGNHTTDTYWEYDIRTVLGCNINHIINILKASTFALQEIRFGM